MGYIILGLANSINYKDFFNYLNPTYAISLTSNFNFVEESAIYAINDLKQITSLLVKKRQCGESWLQYVCAARGISCQRIFEKTKMSGSMSFHFW